MKDDLLMFLDRTRDEVRDKAMDASRKGALIQELSHYKDTLINYLTDDHTNQSFENILLYRIAELLDPRFAVNSRSTGVHNKHYFNDTFIAFYESDLRKMIVPDPAAIDENANSDDDDDILVVVDFNTDTSGAQLQKARFVKEVKEYSKKVLSFYKNKSPEEEDNWRSDFSVLDFWFEMREVFPVLSALATRVLEIPAQESCAERTFSGLTYLLTKARASISPKLAGDMVINYMKKHRSHEKKLMPYPSLGKDWPEGLKGFVRLPARDDNDVQEDELVENVDGQDVAAGEDDVIENAEDAEELVEDGIYPDDDDQEPDQEPPRPQRRARLDYAAMARGRM